MITDFLKTRRSKKDLKIALDVLREFKEHESEAEWFHASFESWTKLEQLEEYLAHLVEGTPLKDDTIVYLKRARKGPVRADGD